MTPADTVQMPRRRFQALAEEVAEAYGISPAELLGEDRSRHLSHPRQHLYALAQERLGWSTTRIGAAVGRDHSTVHYGIRRARERIARGDA
ncbi:helix-turn-helix domain-containing protein [Falsirhodobacter halotolerans]|uniref:helix-turn-helix domain-containing protein n=1 Tax=Falsirhodobacter halotolerans TaxID=1146892 RepID=UPI001FD3C162|nr:helix-turn-helix domain-containing protein [Falsirhodobacter halotolerans]MCJ8138590.1 hypothetical protein [Falsirhodobacter halotolerans]